MRDEFWCVIERLTWFLYLRCGRSGFIRKMNLVARGRQAQLRLTPWNMLTLRTLWRWHSL